MVFKVLNYFKHVERRESKLQIISEILDSKLQTISDVLEIN